MSSTEFMEAVRSGATDAVRAAIAAGADVNQQDAHGWTPLCWAAGKGAVELVELLLAHGADLRTTGRDHRRPSTIALAAGHADAARVLRAAEAAASVPARPPRSYCKAFRVRDLRGFAGWPAAAADGEQIVYLHASYQVTRSMWADEQVVLDGAAPDWQAFCRDELGFAAPDDLDLIGRPGRP